MLRNLKYLLRFAVAIEHETVFTQIHPQEYEKSDSHRMRLFITLP